MKTNRLSIKKAKKGVKTSEQLKMKCESFERRKVTFNKNM
jgi:hypothetical protein